MRFSKSALSATGARAAIHSASSEKAITPALSCAFQHRTDCFAASLAKSKRRSFSMDSERSMTRTIAKTDFSASSGAAAAVTGNMRSSGVSRKAASRERLVAAQHDQPAAQFVDVAVEGLQLGRCESFGRYVGEDQQVKGVQCGRVRRQLRGRLERDVEPLRSQ